MKQQILLDLDNTLLLYYAGYQTMHPRWREMMHYDVTLWSSSDYTPVIGTLLNVPWIIKDDADSSKPTADVLIDDCGAFRRDCLVDEYFKSIDDFLKAQPDYKAQTTKIFNQIKEDYKLTLEPLEFVKNEAIRKAGGGSFATSSTRQWVMIDEEAAFNMIDILLHEMAHAICYDTNQDRGHDGEFGKVHRELKEKYL